MYAGFSGAAVPADRRGKKRHNHRQTVRQRDADAIAAADAGGRELFRDGLHLIAQCAVGEHGDGAPEERSRSVRTGLCSSNSRSVDGVDGAGS